MSPNEDEVCTSPPYYHISIGSRAARSLRFHGTPAWIRNRGRMFRPERRFDMTPSSYVTSTFVLISTDVGRCIPYTNDLAYKPGSADSRGKVWHANVSDIEFLIGTETSRSKRGQRGPPGGKKGVGECLVDAAVREVVEETGIPLDVRRLEFIPFSVEIPYKEAVHRISFWGYIFNDIEVAEFHRYPPTGNPRKNPLKNLTFVTLKDYKNINRHLQVHIGRVLEFALSVWVDEINAYENNELPLYKTTLDEANNLGLNV